MFIILVSYFFEEKPITLNQLPLNRGCTKINLDLNTCDGLRETIELTQRLQDSEAHLTHIISKYIQDHSFEKELRKLSDSSFNNTDEHCSSSECFNEPCKITLRS